MVASIWLRGKAEFPGNVMFGKEIQGVPGSLPPAEVRHQFGGNAVTKVLLQTLVNTFRPPLLIKVLQNKRM